MSKKVTIIGAGWLGTPLAHSLLRSGFHITTTKRNIQESRNNNSNLEGEKLFLDSQADPIILREYSDFILQKIRLSKEETAEYGKYTKLCQQLFEDRQIIITIPPSLFLKGTKTASGDLQISPFSYAQMISYTAELAEVFGASEIIFTSSTSVYGNSSGIIHEGLPAMPKTESAKAIVQAEIALKNNLSIPVTILRLAGLIGNGRHPIYHLSGRKNITEPYNAINLLHIHDLITAIEALLLRDKQNRPYEIFNIVTPYHPKRDSYYQAMAKKLDLPLPLFEQPRPLLKKIIDGQKITEEKDFNYQVADLLQAPISAIV